MGLAQPLSGINNIKLDFNLKTTGSLQFALAVADVSRIALFRDNDNDNEDTSIVLPALCLSGRRSITVRKGADACGRHYCGCRCQLCVAIMNGDVNQG